MNSMSSLRGRVVIAAAWFNEAFVTIAAFEAATIPGSFSVFQVRVASFGAFSAKPSFPALAALDMIVPIIPATIIPGD